MANNLANFTFTGSKLAQPEPIPFRATQAAHGFADIDQTEQHAAVGAVRQVDRASERTRS